jgi:hypothetical protein
MMKRTLMAATAVAMMGLALGSVFAADEPIPVYGGQLMTEQERIEYRNTLRNAKTSEEREQLRMQHHQRMQERAKAKGLVLPEEPPAGSGMRQGGGMGPGGAMMIPPGGKAR